MTGRLQSDPIERRFSQYRQMSGGRFLVSLREVYNSERILACRSLIKENIKFWNEDLSIKEDNEDIKNFLLTFSHLVMKFSCAIYLKIVKKWPQLLLVILPRN